MTGLNEQNWYVIDPDNGVRFGVPGFYRACASGYGNGLLQVVLLMDDGDASADDSGCFPLILSEDEGDTWSAPVLPANYPNGYIVPGNGYIEFGSQPVSLATGTGNAQYLQVVLLGQDGNAYLLWLDSTGEWNFGFQTYLPQNPIQYTLPNPQGLSFTAVAMGTGNNANKLQVILLANGLPWLIWQDTNGVWNWGGELPIGKLDPGVTFTAVTTGIGNGSRLQVLLLGTDGHLYLVWQEVSGQWFPYQDETLRMVPLL